ncbi:MAG: FtsH protease activity modulator HflK, partial [Oscillospiraceae bacterium]
ESSMITSDSNFIDVDFYLEYRVIDPVKFLYNSAEPIAILKTLAQSYSRDIVGLHTVDEVLTTGKQQIQTEIRESIASRIETEDIGIQVLNFTIQDAEPPTNEVLDSFKNVETAKQQKETAINNANKYKNEKEPEAEAKVDKIIKDAEAIKQARINEAEGQVSRFNSMFQEFIKNPLQTKTRMFYETMEEVLPKVKIIIDDGNGSTTKFLPLDQLK